MSQIRKSASFRSKIPIRRAKPVPRRCCSPEPFNNRSIASMYDQQPQIISDDKPKIHSDQRMTKQKMKRQRNIATTIPKQSIVKDVSNSSSTTPMNISGRPKTIYSSSSYSSSDESQVSECPPQVCWRKIKQSFWLQRSLPSKKIFFENWKIFGILTFFFSSVKISCIRGLNIIYEIVRIEQMSFRQPTLKYHVYY